ncbi:MAG TPA: cupin domain-containing protein [Polyangiaceae bacterium]|nr:cupin domain-containing protein [Polyangiaceae bacterium]
MPKLTLEDIPQTNRTMYPAPFAEPMRQRHVRRLAPAAGLTDFGVSHVVLEPGGISSQRHWHAGEDEFVVMLEGEAVLIENGGETVMRPGDCAAFPKGVPDGHHLVNRGDRPCAFLAVGRPADSDCHYPDVDMHLDGATGHFTRKDGTPYP